MYATIWDQCMATVKSKLEQLDGYAQINQDKNPVGLSEEIRNIMCGREAHHHGTHDKDAMHIRPKGDEANRDYKECFDSLCNALE